MIEDIDGIITLATMQMHFYEERLRMCVDHSFYYGPAEK